MINKNKDLKDKEIHNGKIPKEEFYPNVNQIKQFKLKKNFLDSCYNG